jgi:DNA polymerase elongation subunit (family B)
MLQFNVTNIGNIGKEIIIFHRIGKTLSQFHDKSFYPYFYQIDPAGIFKTIDNQKVKKVVCARPADLSRRRDEGSYEADVSFTKRYIIDKIGTFGEAELKYSFIDIEVLCPELPSYLDPKYPISCISYSNSYTGEIKTFFLLDYMSTETQCNIKEADIEDAEKNLLDEFTYCIKAEMFDLSLGWNFIEFDWRYLRARYNFIFGCELSEMLSPIGQSKYLGSSQGEGEQNLIPMGMSVMDYLDMFKKIYKTESSYALDAIVNKHMGIPLRKKIDFNKLTEDIKIKNREDVRLLMELDKKFKIIDYYDELRRMSMCEWTDVTWNSRMLDVILLREAKQKNIILPTKHYGEGPDNPFSTEETFQGAYRRCNILDTEDNILKRYTGLHKNIWKLDLSSAYPAMIINFCLDIANIKNEGVTINKVKFYQNSNALLPTIAQKLINKKDLIKKELKSLNPESNEYKDLLIKYNAVKAVVNSLFGVCGLKIFRLFDYRVASSITYLVRDLLHYVENKLQEKGMEIIYIDTDSIFCQSESNPKDLMNDLIKQWAKENYNKENIDIEFDLEGKYEKLFIISLCHYKGLLQKKSGIEEEVKGIECLDPMSTIPTSTGVKYLKDVAVGEKIYDSSGYLTKIKDKRISTHTSYMKFYIEGKRPLVCSKNHNIFIIRKNKEYLIKAKNIRLGDYLQEPEELYKNNKNYFNKDLAKILGFFYSEGSYYKNNLLKFSLHKKEKLLVKEIKKSIKKMFNLDMHIYPSYNKSKGIYVQKRNKNFIKLKKYINFNGSKNSSNHLHKIPVSLQLAPKQACSIFLKALFSGDGWITRRNIGYSTVSKDLFEGILFILKRFGIKYGEHRQLPNLKNNQPSISYWISIGQSEYYKFYNLIGFYGDKEERLKKYLNQKINLLKNVRCKKFKGNLLHKINKIKIINKTKQLIDIETESGEFLCNYLKVHNSKRKDSSNFIKDFQTKLIDKIMNEEPKENIIKWINSEKERIKTLSILDIGFPCKISKSAEDYKSIPVHIRALAYTKEIIPDFDKRIGDSFYYIYVEPFGTAMRKSTRNKKDKDTGDIKVQSSDKEVKKDVLVFDADNFEHVKNIDWKKMLDRSIYSKCEHIFESLNWDITEIKEAKVRQARKKKVKIDDDNCSQLPDCECDKCQ